MKALKPEAYLQQIIAGALQTAFDLKTEVTIEKPRQESFGDFATTVALGLARELRKPPRSIAEAIVANLDDREAVLEHVSIDGPGFINFTLQKRHWQQVLRQVFALDSAYGNETWGGGERRLVEFVSANPTGPLNVVSARAAAVGDVLVTLFEKVGFEAEREYYINDAGRQIRLLGASVSARYMRLLGSDESMPEEGYQGDYIVDLAREIRDEHGDQFAALAAPKRAETLAQLALAKMVNLHKNAMRQYRVDFQCWYHESDLREQGRHLTVLQKLQARGHTYEKDGATWFKSSSFGDEKDRVLITSEGEPTYFLVDIAYHEDKYERGYKRLFDLWGPDHHGYIPRMTAALEALGHSRDHFQVRIIQQVNMLRGGEVVKMSKRAGNIVEMLEVLDEVGVDAARFFFIMRRLDSPLDFDIELAQKQTDENPVYYVQYAHARLVNIMEYARSQKLEFDPSVDLSTLQASEEITVLKKLAEYPEVISKAAELLEPHRLTTYLLELAGAFHSFYQQHRVIGDDPTTSQARLALVNGTRLVIRNALAILKITAPERM